MNRRVHINLTRGTILEYKGEKYKFIKHKKQGFAGVIRKLGTSKRILAWLYFDEFKIIKEKNKKIKAKYQYLEK